MGDQMKLPKLKYGLSADASQLSLWSLPCKFQTHILNCACTSSLGWHTNVFNIEFLSLRQWTFIVP